MGHSFRSSSGGQAMSPQEMDVCQSLRKIARELDEAATDFDYGLGSKEEFIAVINGAAWLINYIADGLEHELGVAQQRANELKFKQIGMGTVDYT